MKGTLADSGLGFSQIYELWAITSKDFGAVVCF
jgi:hypothetical protein